MYHPDYLDTLMEVINDGRRHGAVWADSFQLLRWLRSIGFTNWYGSSVMDPPYGLTSIERRFGGNNAPAQGGADGAFSRLSGGFMGVSWDGTGIEANPEFWYEHLCGMKPGGHVLAFSATRTYHRMAWAMEQAGYEIFDMIQWGFLSGFPKLSNMGIRIDKHLGAERTEVISTHKNPETHIASHMPEEVARKKGGYLNPDKQEYSVYAPATPEAAEWEGYNTMLKPCFEPIVLARKPPEGSYAANTLKWGVGGLNINESRVEKTKKLGKRQNIANLDPEDAGHPLGSYPPNMILSHGYDCIRLASGKWDCVHGCPVQRIAAQTGKSVASLMEIIPTFGYHEEDFCAANFVPKPGKGEKNVNCGPEGNRHATIKPIDMLMWMQKLVTPPKEICYNAFGGSGSDRVAAIRGNVRYFGSELERESFLTDERRAAHPYMRGKGGKRRNKAQAGLFGED